MSDKTVTESLEELFQSVVLGDEMSHELYQSILERYDLIEAAVLAHEGNEEVTRLCAHTKEMLALLSDPSHAIAEESAEAVRRGLSALQLLLLEDADPKDVNFPDLVVTEPVAEEEAGAANDDTDQGDGRREDEPAEAGTSEDEDAATKGEPIDLSAFLADAEMAGDFIGESVEHIEQVDVHLLTLEQDTEDSEALNAVFRAFHTIKGLSGFFGLSHIQGFAHVAETLLDWARDGRITLQARYLDLIFDANECLRRAVKDLQDALESGAPVTADPSMVSVGKKLQEALEGVGENGGSVEKETPDAGPAKEEDPVAPICLEEEAPQEEEPQTGVVQESEEKSTPPNAKEAAKEAVEQPQQEKGALQKESPVAAGAKPGKGKSLVRETIRVDAARLDLLMDSVGELVIAESILAEADELKAVQSSHIESLLCHMDKITRELQEMAMSLRMMPIRPTFQKMARLARDVAKKLNRRVEFVTTGDDTELDKSVVDSLGDPLVHMVRNAIDHGLEKTVEERRAAGKPDVGHVELRAFHQGGNIVIEIEDDGRGMDREAILKKAIANGIVENGDGMSDSDVFGLIFAPGFSTAETITDVSGRGVGLDVVKRGIEALRGTVEVNSTPGKGTVFTLRLPLTLAIIEGMVVRVGSQKYIVPTLSIVRMQKFAPDDVSTILESGKLLRVGDALVPLYWLSEVFDTDSTGRADGNQSVVIVEGNKRQYAFVVDELIGQQQIVIKGLGQIMGGTRGLSGGAIMADGRVGLILDIGSLVRLAESIDVVTD